jgi:hypothetical protein
VEGWARCVVVTRIVAVAGASGALRFLDERFGVVLGPVGL